MLYLIGLGLNRNGISKEAQQIVEKAHKVYLEGYTVDFPYNVEDLHLSRKKIEVLDRKKVESNMLIKEALSKKIVLLVYGSPLFATTHLSLLLDAKEQGVRTKVIYSASVFDAIGETGLQLYKFGKIASMPDWKDKGKSDSFMDLIKDNQSIKAHSLILCDIGLDFASALEQLQEAADAKKVKLDKIVVCSRMGSDDRRISYNTIDKLRKKDFEMPFCLIVPSDMHFLEEEGLKMASFQNVDSTK